MCSTLAFTPSASFLPRSVIDPKHALNTACLPHIPLTKIRTATRRSCSMVASVDAHPKLAKLGDSDLMVPNVCLGTMTWGKQNTMQEAHQQLDYAFERGFRFIDTAEMYPVPPEAKLAGTTDRYIGEWLKKLGNGKRQDVVIASKVAGGGRRSIPYIRGGSRLDRKQIIASVEDSLTRLGTDYIDLLQIHWPDRYVPLFGQRAYDRSEYLESTPIPEQLEAFQQLIDQGKVRYIGLSNETAWGVAQFDAAAKQNTALPKPISIQNSYSLLHRQFEMDLAEACAPENANMPLLAYSPLAGGALSGKYLDNQVPEGARFSLFKGYMARFQASLAMEAVAKYADIARKHNISPSTLALAWCKKQWFIQSTIIGATSLEQLEENLNAFSIDLDEEIIQEIESVYKRYRDPSQF